MISRSKIILLLFATVFALTQFASAQFKSQEISEEDGIPVLIKHLPDWEKAKDQAKLTGSITDVRAELGDRPVLKAIDLSAGAEAAIVPYPAGKLLLIEFPTPQMSSAADAAIQASLADSPVVYKRIGNYNALVFDANDPVAANDLLAQIKYEKAVQWLGEDPYLLKKIEHYLVGTSADVLVSTAIFITACLGGAVVAGILVGFVFFRLREQKRVGRHAFSDAGGLTRLNLDDLSE